MKRIFLLLTATLSLSSIAPAAAPPAATASNPLTFTSGGAFKFNIPVGFSFSEPNGPHAYPVFVNAPTNYTAYMQIASDAYQGDLKQFVRNEIGGFRSSPALANVAVPSTGAITTRTGVHGIRVILTFNSAKGPMEMAAYYFQKPGEVEVLHGICFAQLASQVIPLFDASANSIVLLK